ncbi:hypothetical protein NMY22_g16323 [Coprinellus aureogranulatus]|nr:hypothetical protein NMY22_g16323 [Coprinellus aureogranulatus]
MIALPLSPCWGPVVAVVYLLAASSYPGHHTLTQPARFARWSTDVVWQDIKQIGLIDSIYRNFYVPPIIFATKTWSDGRELRDTNAQNVKEYADESCRSETKVCIDGKQRLTSIRRFMEGCIPHKDPETSEKWYYIDNPAVVTGRRGACLVCLGALCGTHVSFTYPLLRHPDDPRNLCVYSYAPLWLDHRPRRVSLALSPSTAGLSVFFTNHGACRKLLFGALDKRRRMKAARKSCLCGYSVCSRTSRSCTSLPSPLPIQTNLSPPLPFTLNLSLPSPVARTTRHGANARRKAPSHQNTPSDLVRSIVHTYVTSGGLNPSILDWDASRGADFRCVASAIYCIAKWPSLDKGYASASITIPGIETLNKWLSSKDPVPPSFRSKIDDTFHIFSDIAQDKKLSKKAFKSVFVKEGMRGAGEPAKVAPLEFVCSAVLVGVWREM